MGNPFERARVGSRHLEVGEQRVLAQGTVIERTKRDYVYDLCDAYNAQRSRGDIEWYVAAGVLHLGTPLDAAIRTSREIERRKEADRDNWKRARSSAQRFDADQSMAHQRPEDYE